MVEELEELDFIMPAARMELRDYQVECMTAIHAAWERYWKILIVLCTGGGKTIIFSHEAKRTVDAGGKVLILAHTDELLEQAIDKLFKSTGLVASKEKAGNMASSDASVVVASIQTLSRENRLRGFRDSHFDLVIVDEVHRILAPSYQRVVNYFHYGQQSLAQEWVAPVSGIPYEPKSRLMGVTATPDRGDRRTLGEIFELCAFEYGLLQAVRDGYLVRPIVRNIPVKIDIRGVKTSRLSGQSDYDTSEVAKKLSPFLHEIAHHISTEARNRKTVVFTPSIETARMLSEELLAVGMDADFVSGACANRSDKIAAFEQGAKGRVIVCAMLLIEGWDCPSADCVCMLRPTKIRSMLSQAVGRGTRTLPGTIDGLTVPEDRLQAIENSAKKDLLILDFLWLTDRLDLIRPVDLVTSKPEIKKAIEESGEVDLEKAEATAERDLLKSLEKAAKKVSHKKSRTMDPLAWAVSVGDTALAAWVPDSKWDELPASEAQMKFLSDQGVAPFDKVLPCGLAKKLIERISSRKTLKLCSPKQMNLLLGWGFSEERAALMSQAQAGVIISRKFAPR